MDFPRNINHPARILGYPLFSIKNPMILPVAHQAWMEMIPGFITPITSMISGYIYHDPRDQNHGIIVGVGLSP